MWYMWKDRNADNYNPYIIYKSLIFENLNWLSLSFDIFLTYSFLLNQLVLDVHWYYYHHYIQGFLQAELVAEAHKGLRKRCTACSELLMQNVEKLDAIVSCRCVRQDWQLIITRLAHCQWPSVCRTSLPQKHCCAERGKVLYKEYR